MLDIKELEKKINEVDIVQVFTTDLNGRAITLQVNPGNIEAFFKRGVGFDGSSVSGYGSVDNSDKLLIPLANTFRALEFSNEKLGFFIGRIDEEQGDRSLSDPRALLENVLEQAREEFGFQFLAGPEHEFFLLMGDEYNKDIHSDKAGYFHADPRDRGESVRKEIVLVLEKCGIQFEKMHHEVTPSQHEINLGCLDPLSAADRTVLFMYITQRVTHENDLHATFMPKPFNGQNRNAFHIHLSAQDQDGHHLFFDPGEKNELSTLARQFIAGIVKYARETSIIMASTFNSYKAYVIGKEAPIVRGWGLKNRSSMVRIPYSDAPENKRIEIRSPDPSGNVYLQMATLIGMGLQGIREKLDCGDPDTGSNYDLDKKKRLWDRRFLPGCMFEALVEAEGSTFLKDFLGDMLFTHYLDLKKEEWEGYRTYVTPREHKRNL
ncbi:MAG: glutamine synthetase [Desulfobacteraceae bacterium]|nr:glutamine synthetase [Desulfobacteraceae bacterium]MBC2757932.1 glutamine synthetase [Desulfobacteraceae bacterium]